MPSSSTGILIRIEKLYSTNSGPWQRELTIGLEGTAQSLKAIICQELELVESYHQAGLELIFKIRTIGQKESNSSQQGG
jgi:hypothetical protein